MNALERKRKQHHDEIRELAARIRALRLDREDVADDDGVMEAVADAIYKVFPEEDVNEALAFAKYIGEMTDPNCAECKGRGAVERTINGKPFYTPCVCAEQGEKRAREAAPPVRVKGALSRDEDLGRRIAKVREQLASAQKRQDEAVAPVVTELTELAPPMAAYTERRAAYVSTVEEYTKRTADGQAEVADRWRKVREAEATYIVATGRAKLRAKVVLRHAQLEEAEMEEHSALLQEELAQYTQALTDFDARHTDLIERVRHLEKLRDRIARHHAPKIERAERTLRRLTWLRGAEATPHAVQQPAHQTVDEVTVEAAK